MKVAKDRNNRQNYSPHTEMIKDIEPSRGEYKIWQEVLLPKSHCLVGKLGSPRKGVTIVEILGNPDTPNRVYSEIYTINKHSFTEKFIEVKCQPSSQDSLNIKTWTDKRKGSKDQALENQNKVFADSILQEVEMLFQDAEVHNREEIKSFLLENSVLINLLKRSFEEINNVFGKNQQGVLLRLNVDPEENFEKVKVYVKTDLSVDDAITCLEQLEDQWFLDNVPSDIASIFSIDVKLA